MSEKTKKLMKILIIEDDVNDCNEFKKCAQDRNDIEIVGITDSDVEGLQLVKVKHPEGIVLDIELNQGKNGNTDSLGFLIDLKKLKLNYDPIVIVTTHINSKRTYEVLHRNGVELILYKDQPKYSANQVLNNFINLRKLTIDKTDNVQKEIDNNEEKLLNLIDSELNLVGIAQKMIGREYIKNAIFYLIQNDEDKINVTQYLINKYKKSSTTITNGIQNAINYAWRISPTEDLEKYYKARINYTTGVPTPMEFIYYYVEKIKKEL